MEIQDKASLTVMRRVPSRSTPFAIYVWPADWKRQGKGQDRTTKEKKDLQTNHFSIGTVFPRGVTTTNRSGGRRKELIQEETGFVVLWFTKANLVVVEGKVFKRGLGAYVWPESDAKRPSC